MQNHTSSFSIVFHAVYFLVTRCCPARYNKLHILFLHYDVPHRLKYRTLQEGGVICRTHVSEVLELGLVELITRRNNAVRAYDLERILCNPVRIQGIVNLQIVAPVIQNYVKSPKRDVAKLVKYVCRLDFYNKIRNYLKVLL